MWYSQDALSEAMSLYEWMAQQGQGGMMKSQMFHRATTISKLWRATMDYVQK